jgi:hypothetical protein
VIGFGTYSSASRFSERVRRSTVASLNPAHSSSFAIHSLALSPFEKHNHSNLLPLSSPRRSLLYITLTPAPLPNTR